MKNIVLIGFMGSGKTTVAKILSKKLGLDFLDMDAEIEKREGMKIKKIFSLRGESYFRKIEARVAAASSRRSGLALSTGGGVVKKRKNIAALKKKGVIVYLQNSFDVSRRRLKGKKDRPLFREENLRAARELFAERRGLYREAADVTINTDKLSPAATAQAVIKKIKRFGAK